MEIILIQLINFQDYIVDNIDNLLKHGNNITLITDKKFISRFSTYNINIIPVETLIDIDDYNNIINITKNTFRNGFWTLTKYRFIILSRYMKLFNKKNIIHIENDVLVYSNLNNLNFHTKDKILITMDSNNRCIPGFIFIPNENLLNICIPYFINNNLNDMQIFAFLYYKFPDIFDTLPIFKFNNDNDITTMVTKNFYKYNAIFDAAAIGQYIGGIDPKNTTKINTEGFINETCVINYSYYKFIWKTQNNLKCPFIIINNNEYPIINLHIHSKNLKKYIS